VSIEEGYKVLIYPNIYPTSTAYLGVVGAKHPYLNW